MVMSNADLLERAKAVLCEQIGPESEIQDGKGPVWAWTQSKELLIEAAFMRKHSLI